MSIFASAPYCIQGTDRSCIISDSYSFLPLQIFIHKPETNHQDKNGISPPCLGQGEGRAGSCSKATRVDKHRIICGFKNSKYNEIQKTVEKTKNLKRAKANDNLKRQHI